MYIIYLSFFGHGVHGWQMQVKDTCFQNILKDTLAQIFRTDDIPNPTGCSRTDADVHALEFIATMRAVRDIPPDSLKKGLNSLLPKNIRVWKVLRQQGFKDARDLVVGKHYRYLIYNGPTISPFIHSLVWHSPYPLDIEKMNKAAQVLVGTHDFSTFRAANTHTKTTERRLYQIEISRNGEFVVIDMIGDGFLKHMVRIIGGTLVAISKGRLSDMDKILASCDRFKAGETLPGKGLYLYKLFENMEDMENYKIPCFTKEFLFKLPVAE